MILSPIQGEAKWGKSDWTVKWPVVTQKFGLNPQLYQKFGMKGHEGLDFRAAIGTPCFAPIEGRAKVESAGPYGIHITITNSRLQVILAHLSKVHIKSGDFVHMGDKIALTGNTGNSQAPHLHMVCQRMKNKKVENYDNGYFGGFDFEPFVIRWKGSLTNPTL